MVNYRSLKDTVFNALSGGGFGIQKKLLGAFAVITIMSLAGTLIGWVAFSRLGSSISNVTGREIPRMNLMNDMAALSLKLRAQAPLLSGAESETEVDDVAVDLGVLVGHFNETVGRLNDDKSVQDDSTAQLNKRAQDLIAALDKLEANVRRRAVFANNLAALTARSAKAYRLFDKAAKARGGDLGSLPTLASSLAQNLANGAASPGPLVVGRFLLLFRSTVRETTPKIDAIGGSSPELAARARELISFGDDANGMFALRRNMLYARDDEKAALKIAMNAADLLVKDTDSAVVAVQGRVHDATLAAQTAQRAGSLSLLLLALASVAVSVFVVLVVVRRGIVMRLTNLANAMLAIARKELDHPIDSGGQDEITDMANALVVFRDTTREVDAANAKVEAERIQAAKQRRAEMLKMADNLEASVAEIAQNLSSNATTMHGLAGNMSNAADQSKLNADEAAQTAERTSSNVNTVAAATQELSSSITEIASQMARFHEFTDQTIAETQQTDDAMNSLVSLVGEIGDVAGLINSIAHLTHLLALNATIEAARAGEHGKGFAVVAAEVKGLATQTAEATSEINQRTKVIQTVTSQVADAVRRISKTMSNLGSLSVGIASAIEEQEAATREISRNVDQTSQGTGELYQVLQMLSELARSAAQSSTQVLGASSDVSTLVDTLRDNIDQVVSHLREDAERAEIQVAG